MCVCVVFDMEVASAASIENKSVSVQFPDEEKYTGIGARLPIANFQLKYIGKDTGITYHRNTMHRRPRSSVRCCMLYVCCMCVAM